MADNSEVQQQFLQLRIRSTGQRPSYSRPSHRSTLPSSSQNEEIKIEQSSFNNHQESESLSLSSLSTPRYQVPVSQTAFKSPKEIFQNSNLKHYVRLLPIFNINGVTFDKVQKGLYPMVGNSPIRCGHCSKSKEGYELALCKSGHLQCQKCLLRGDKPGSVDVRQKKLHCRVCNKPLQYAFAVNKVIASHVWGVVEKTFKGSPLHMNLTTQDLWIDKQANGQRCLRLKPLATRLQGQTISL